MVLSRAEIIERLNMHVSQEKSLVITPLLFRHESDIFDAESVDLRLGCHFLVPKTLDQPFFSPDRSSATSLHARVHVPLGQFLVVPAHQTILGATLEFLKLPSDVSGQVLTKSSVARTFIVVETAPWIHPQYRGCLTLEIANVSNTPVLLYPGRSMCQLILLKIAPYTESGGNSQSEVSPDKKYFGPVYPEAPKFKDPHEDLLEIGTTLVSDFKRRLRRAEKNRWSDAEEETDPDQS
ncbi:MAG: dCTP deaminase [Terriglobales bacterium]